MNTALRAAVAGRQIEFDPDEWELEQQRRVYERSLFKFMEAAWRYIDPAPFTGGWHLEAMAEHLEAVTRGELRHLLINIPPRLTKSLLVSVSWQAWVWAQRVTTSSPSSLAGPHVQFLTTSYALPLALRDSVRTRRLIESPWYQKYWGHRFKLSGDQNTKGRFENDQGGVRLATSVGGALTGEGGNVISFDDPHNVIEIESDAAIDAVTQWWDESLSTRLNDPKTDVFVGVMQRISERDLSGHILDHWTKDWTHLCLPMEFDPQRRCVTSLGWEDPRDYEGELLAPERFDAEALWELKQRLGPFGVAGQLQQSPSPRGGGIIKRSYWQMWPPQGEQFDAQGQPIKILAYPEMDFILASLDTAMTAKEESDFSALTIWGIWMNAADMPQVMLMEAWAEHYDFHTLVEKVILTCRKRKVDRLLVEAKNNGFSVVQEIQRLCVGEQFAAYAEPVKGDKVARAHACVAVFAAGQVWRPDRRWADKVVDQCASFPKGQNDDLVDSTTQALRHMRQANLLQMVAEKQEELRHRLAPHAEKQKALPYDA